MIDFEKTKAEAEAFAKLSVEQYYREVLSAELDDIKMTCFGQKKPLKDILPSFAVALIGLCDSVRDIYRYIEKVPKEDIPEFLVCSCRIDEFEDCTKKAKEKTPAEVLEIINKKPIFSDRFVESAKKITEPKAAEEAPSMAAVHITNETIKELLSQGLTQKEIADKTGMTPNAVSHRLAYTKNREFKEKGIEKPASKPKCYSKELISDEELEEMYFKQGMTVRDIAKKYGIIPDGLYKRTEALKAKRIEVAKECVSSQ